VGLFGIPPHENHPIVQGIYKIIRFLMVFERKGPCTKGIKSPEWIFGKGLG
jgi:hypothetical protein